jgi:hypothetical protein
MTGQSETLSTSEIIFIKLFSAGAQAFFASHGNVRNYAEPKPFSGGKRAQVGFFLHLILLCRIT